VPTSGPASAINFSFQAQVIVCAGCAGWFSTGIMNSPYKNVQRVSRDSSELRSSPLMFSIISCMADCKPTYLVCKTYISFGLESNIGI